MKRVSELQKEKRIAFVLCIAVLMVTVANFVLKYKSYKEDNNSLYDYSLISSAYLAQNTDYTYLSDIDYVANASSTAWGTILKDTTSAGTKISVKVQGAYYTFDKGMWAHASSTLVYDISKYDYKYFTAFMGLNATAASSSNGVKFYVYTSDNGSDWTLVTDEEPVVVKAGMDAIEARVNIEGANYLKLVVNDNGSNGNDHAVYADAKLTNEETSNAVPEVSYYDAEISKKYANGEYGTEALELLLLQRKLVNSVGQYAITRFLSESDANKQAFNWLFNDVQNLRYYIIGGTPAGSYYNSLEVLSKLYANYKNDFTITTKSKYGNVLGDLYKRMAIALSLTHSTTVGLWMQATAPENGSDAVTRYKLYKQMYDNGKFVVTSSLDVSEWFETYSIEEMRFVMNNALDDEETIWLNEYTQARIDQYNSASYLTPHSYIAYVWPNYSNAVFHTEANKSYFDELFGGIFSKYGVTFRSGLYKVWMNMRNQYGTGAVCGGISKTGANIRQVHGVAATVIGQPGHAALLYYTKNSDGNGYWGIDNDVSGWTLSEKSERMLNGWGNASYSKGYSVVYMVLAQEALNDYENYEKSQELVLLADSYKGNSKKQEEIYRKALDTQSINIDAWYGLISLYLADESKTEKDYYDLAVEIGEALKNFPLPMYHLTNLLGAKLTSVEYSFAFTLLQTKELTYGSKTTTTDVVQPSVTRTEANYLLGRLDKDLATFSFDGDDANKIALASRFDGSGVRWDYSLDGANTWKEVVFTGEDEHKWLLTNSEVKSITEDNDIYVHIVGTNYSEENLFKIDITKGSIPDTFFANDLENRVVGVNLSTDWKYTGDTKWTSYATASPDLTGDKSVDIRMSATGTQLASDQVTYTFTADNQPDTRKYISVSHLSIEAVSTEATSNAGSATYSIDGNYNTRWHSAWNGTDTERYITIKLNYPVYLSAVEFVPAGGGNGKIYDGTVYGSMDGETWFELSKQTGLTYTNQANTVADAIANTKSFEIETPQEVQYVKIVADRTNGNWFTARAFNLYEDVTSDPRPKAGIGYSTTEPTNQSVVARLVNPSTKIRVTNNGGSDTYTFTENGEFTFEFIDDTTKLTGSATATVTWIDKTAPTVKVTYNPSQPVNGEVLATITPSEAIVVTNYKTDNVDEAGNQLLTKNAFTYIFLDNGEFVIKYQDAAGNQGSTTLKVDWIDKTLEPNIEPTTPTTKPSTSTTTSTTKKVTTTTTKLVSTTAKTNTALKGTTTKKTTKKASSNTVTNNSQGASNTTDSTSTEDDTDDDLLVDDSATGTTTTTKKVTTNKANVTNYSDTESNPWSRYLIVISLAILIMIIAAIVIKKHRE